MELAQSISISNSIHKHPSRRYHQLVNVKVKQRRFTGSPALVSFAHIKQAHVRQAQKGKGVLHDALVRSRTWAYVYNQPSESSHPTMK